MVPIQNSELILNKDGSIYHLNLRPEHLADTIITVGDPERVSHVSRYFSSIECSIQKREFNTVTGIFNQKRITVISTGIGADNIDIVLNELDALANIDLKTRCLKEKHKALNIVRIGTSGSIQPDIAIDSFLISKYGLGLDGMIHSYDCEHILDTPFEDAFMAYTNWNMNKGRPYAVQNNIDLEQKLKSNLTEIGCTATANGFYGPQGRILRLPISSNKLNEKMSGFVYKNMRITNLEMETAAIYAMAKLLGHKAISMNAILANRANGTFSTSPEKTVAKLIVYTLEKLTE